eukprot:14043179-Ditylum_brightwellii.AAC.1
MANCLYNNCNFPFPLVLCKGCSALNTHHLCQNDFEMELWKLANPSLMWPPAPHPTTGVVYNEFEQNGWYCRPCHSHQATTGAVGPSPTQPPPPLLGANAAGGAGGSGDIDEPPVIDMTGVSDDTDAERTDSSSTPFTKKRKTIPGAVLALKQAHPRSTKPTNNTLHNCFNISTMTDEGGKCAIVTAASTTVTSTKASTTTNRLSLSKPNKKHKQLGLVDAGITSMTDAEANEILIPHVITTVSHRELLDRMIDQFFQAALIKIHPAIKSHLSLTVQTVYKKYVLKIDEMAQEELVEHMMCLPRNSNFSFDGVTINRKSKQVYTITREHMTVFDPFTDLGSDNHNSKAEVADAMK